MKVFKIAAIALCALLCFPRAAVANAAADGREYARADKRNIYFCTEMDDASALFAIPYTYCVEIIADHGEWYLVRYAQDDGLYRALTGYCRKEGLTEIETLPENLYLNYPVTATLRSNVPQSSLPGLEITVTAAYYGVFYLGAAAYSYVLYDGSFNYIEGANENYPLNEIPSEPAFSETDPPAGEADNSKLITAIIVCVAAASVIVFLILSGKRKSQRSKG